MAPLLVAVDALAAPLPAALGLVGVESRVPSGCRKRRRVVLMYDHVSCELLNKAVYQQQCSAYLFTNTALLTIACLEGWGHIV